VDADDRPSLSAPAAVGVAVLFQFAAIVAVGIASIPFVTRTGDVITTSGGLGPIYASFLGAWPVLAAGTYLIARGSGRPWREWLGLQHIRPIDALGVPIGVALQYAIGAAYALSSVDEKQVSKPARELTDRAGSFGVGFVILGILVVVGAPLFEELFYRGAVLGGLRRVADETMRKGVSSGLLSSMALAISALWFAAIHGQALQFPALAAVGLLCGVARMRTGRLTTSMAIHLGFNLVTMIALGLEISRR
jgi:membrane protease YdiL (CAAX protease family)